MAKAPPIPTKSGLNVSTGRKDGPQRILIYGPGGIGKSSLAASLKDVGRLPLFLDTENSTNELDVRRVGADEGLAGWDELLSAMLDEQLIGDCKAVVVDSLTRAEEWAVSWTIRNVPHEKGHKITRLEDYGYGKGYSHVYDTMLALLANCDAQIRRGRDVVLIAHLTKDPAPNPAGEDFLRYEPRMLSSKGRSIRERVVEWSDHTFFVDYDVAIVEGRAQGSGTRTIYTQQDRPCHVAKSRRLSGQIPFTKGSAELWEKLFGTTTNESD